MIIDPHWPGPSRQGGFALITSLAVLVLLSTVVVAYMTVMRTERTASQNYNDHDRSQAIAMGVLNRILAEHASPVVSGKPLAPFKLKDDNSGLPDLDSAQGYYGTGEAARAQLEPIYRMKPDDEAIFNETGLVRASKSSTGSADEKDAYTADFWAYDGLTEKVLGSTDAQPKSVPKWVDYYEVDPQSGQKKTYPSAQVAFAIWDEGGKIDINMTGPDGVEAGTGKTTAVNGIAPYDLQFEKVLTSDKGVGLLGYLDGGNSKRERSNFSLRKISNTPTTNDKGDDRWLFSVRELVEKGLIDPTKVLQVTTMSRDFDVRPEWDGDRAPLAIRKITNSAAVLGAEDYLRSYVNNPDLYDLYFKVQNVQNATNPQANFVQGTLNDKTLSDKLKQALPTVNISPPAAQSAEEGNWMQIMRLLAILRRTLPETTIVATPTKLNIFANKWSANDVWGIGLNIIQATTPPSDHNLLASNGAKGDADPNVRQGIRISPYVTAMSVKVKKVAEPTQGVKAADDNKVVYEISEYVTVWNPFPFRLLKPDGTTPIPYRVGSYTMGALAATTVQPAALRPEPYGDTWPKLHHGLYAPVANAASSATTVATDDSWKNLAEAPPPGEFTYVRLGPIIGGLPQPRKVTPAMLEKQNAAAKPGGQTGFLVRMRDYVLNRDYYGSWTYLNVVKPNLETVYYSVNMTQPYPAADIENNPNAFIPKTSLPTTVGQVAWYSFQIDDPRMGAIPRRVKTATIQIGDQDGTAKDDGGNDYRYSWRGYLNKHSIDYNRLKKDYPDENAQDFTSSYNGKTFKVNGTPVAGFNANFGAHWPGADATNGIPSGDQVKFDLMMSTFALPGRPFLNLGELGNVFAGRPWTTLSFANKVSPLNTSFSPNPNNYKDGEPPQRPSALLDYYTTVGGTTAQLNLNFRPPGSTIQGPTGVSSVTANVNARYQDKRWLFESVEGSGNAQKATGNLRPIRGRINLNTASNATLVTLLMAPYRMPASIGLKGIASTPGWTIENVDQTPQSDYWITIDREKLAQPVADLITAPISSTSVRPLRALSDLSRMFDPPNDTQMKELLNKYPQSIINAMIGRLAQFGTVRSQAYTIDLAVRSLHPEAEKKKEKDPSLKSVVTSEVRLQARVFFDSFSRKAFIESLQFK